MHRLAQVYKTRALRFIFLLCLYAAGADSRASDEHIAVIVAPDFHQTITDSDDVARIFRRRLRVAEDGTLIVPVNLPIDHPLRLAFSLVLFDMPPDAMESYWNERYFHGISPPHVVTSSEAMLRFVASTPGAIGYVRGCERDARVEVLLKLPVVSDIDALEPCPPDLSERLPDLQTKIAQ